MYEGKVHYQEKEVPRGDTLSDLLCYWERGLLSDEEMVARWHACHYTDEQRIQQLHAIVTLPFYAEWWSDS